ncbi:hypothetical protein [Paracidovorax avenae]|uniref:hypothetical protein n=1 Tax=Paracidovorax avenae TaxID=80867 RepID=UPI001AD8073A|nr:hypothetical protein [Paracidovorax avenae]
MLWAVREANPERFVHIGMLSAKENGSACKCLCKGCQEKVLAINADKPASHFELPGTQRRHFKHRHTRGAEARCLRKIAQMVALQVFVEQQIVYLPERSRKTERQMPNGTDLIAEMSSAAESVLIRSRTWVDDLSALLVLDDGRELLVTVRAVQTLEHGSSTCILSLAGAIDPMLASWDTEQILDHLRVPGRARWQRHWEDEAKYAAIEADLAQQQSELLGEIPPDWLVGLTGKQFGETILHFLIKRALANLREITVPQYRAVIQRVMPDRTVAEEIAYWPACTLRIEDVRVEKRLGDMVPDVICLATPTRGSEPSFDLMIEGAVTHFVDSAKHQKIVSAGIACIEIVAALFGRSGAISAPEIRDLVARNLAAKHWIHIPQARYTAEERLNRRAEAIREQMALAEQQRLREEAAREEAERQLRSERERVSKWLRDSSDIALVKGYLKIRQAGWGGATEYLTGSKKEHYGALLAEMEARGIYSEPLNTVEADLGILRRLVSARDDPWIDVGEEMLEWLGAAAAGSIEAIGAIELMAALSVRRGEMNAPQLQRYEATAEMVRAQVQAGAKAFQRDGRKLKLYALVVPQLESAEFAEFGTPQHFARMQVEKEAAARRAGLRKARLEKVRTGRIVQSLKAAQSSIEGAIKDEAQHLRWRQYDFGLPSSIVFWTWYNQRRAGMRFTDLDAQSFIQTAVRFRVDGKTPADVLLAMKITRFEDVATAARALVVAGICKSTRQ